MKVWVETIGIVCGMFLAVIGIVIALVSGLHFYLAPVGLLLFAAGGFLVWKVRGAAPVSSEEAVNTGRAVQRPLTPEEQKKGGFRGKI